MTGQTIALAAASLAMLYGVQKALEYRRLVAQCGDLPYKVTVLNPLSMVSFALAAIRGTPAEVLTNGYAPFEEGGYDAYAQISLYPSGIVVHVADPSAIKDISMRRVVFPKPLGIYKGFAIFGNNIIASEGDEWRKYHRISAPAFSERNIRLVWNETCTVMRGLMDDVWVNAPEVVVPHFLDISLPIALFVIGAAGFGRRISWDSDNYVPPGHQLSFKAALDACAHDMGFRVMFSERILSLTAPGRRVLMEFEELDRYMLEMIRSRRSGDKRDERHDLFSGLLDAADEEAGGRVAISDRELMGNIFIFLVAGHETTAHSICFTLAYLALYPEVQDKLYAEIRTVMNEEGASDLTWGYEVMSKLSYALAVFHETLRLQPAVVSIPKMAAEDTSLSIHDGIGNAHTFPVPAGAIVLLDAAAMQRNPRLWTDPLLFNPDRWLTSVEDKEAQIHRRDAFVAFSSGARRCMGQRFSEAEAVAILCCLLSRYSVHLTHDDDVPNESAEARRVRREKILDHVAGATIKPKDVPLTFKRRS
ncbi:unnamed protein product [Peniophora sp. CBMAI 1063]|nr:unnamed protein product [Peniophora sp. CBMAI 1063]